jgi:hypothetical protein
MAVGGTPALLEARPNLGDVLERSTDVFKKLENPDFE